MGGHPNLSSLGISIVEYGLNSESVKCTLFNFLELATTSVAILRKLNVLSCSESVLIARAVGLTPLFFSMTTTLSPSDDSNPDKVAPTGP